MGERMADAVGAVRLTARSNLQRFKELVEARGMESGAWRGTVPQQGSGMAGGTTGTMGASGMTGTSSTSGTSGATGSPIGVTGTP
jgi:hypothetical protein